MRGDTIPAIAPAAFMSALALPAQFGATSIVTVQIGAIAKPRKNKEKVKLVTPQNGLCTRIAGTSDATARIQHAAIRPDRAIRRFPVRRSTKSVTTPPRNSENIEHS